MSDKKPIVNFTIQEAIEHYKGDPMVMCLSDEEVGHIDSSTIHAVEYAKYPEPWIWCYKKDDSTSSILLYAPGKLSTDYYKAPIIGA